MIEGNPFMNDRKIAVIAQCDPNGVSSIRPYIDALDIPNGYEAELIEVRSDGNVADTYQRAMEQSDAKYKVYLAAGSILLRLNFFAEMLRVFEEPAIGIMGIVGTAQLSTSGELGASPMLKGRLLYTDDTAFHGAVVEGATEEVMAVSNDLIATQYDIPWRRDLFHINCFFAEAQCIEFRRKGYRTVVPQQDAPWLLTRKREGAADEASRNVLLDTYSKDIYPLVPIVIPTFEPQPGHLHHGQLTQHGDGGHDAAGFCRRLAHSLRASSFLWAVRELGMCPQL